MTKDCIFDVVAWKPHIRFSTSSANLCFECKDKIKELQGKIVDKDKGISFEEEIIKVLSKKMVGQT